jgi:hypothetical protein
MTLTVGDKYGSWTVLEKLGYKGKYACVCACGYKQNIKGADLKKGKSRMCRYCAREQAPGTKHGMRNTSEYNTWVHMIQRCHNPNNKDYPNYGGRGIIVCDMWRESFEAFYMTIGPKTTPEHTIERIDTNGNYAPGNVKWATRTEQNRNQRSNVNLTIGDVTKSVSEWSLDEDCPVSKFTIFKRLDRGWGPRRAVFEPSQKKHGKQQVE